MGVNQINYKEVKIRLDRLEELTETVDSSLKDINSIINETVNTNKGIWDGETANEFLNNWQEFAEEIPTLIQIFKHQENNLKTILTEVKYIEENN